ncbi:SusC/RagA family TonB-linked outer membrane protein [Flavobacteriaceae bacterium Ap0902]|nr:SusC/RagA family TonB-linked outer membrane protein [Flavobacteriaceae bacterium Ap0902]
MRVNLKLLCTAMLLAGTVFTWAQEKNISGQVTDSFGFPVTDAFVHVEGSENGVYTDADGNYDLSVNEGDVVVIEYIGLETQTIAVGDANTYSVQLMEGGAIDVGSIVALGYQEKTEDQISSAVSVIGADELSEQAPSTSIDNMMQGKAAGVQVTSLNGKPGSVATVQIRGVGSTGSGGPSTPLYVIDGVYGTEGDMAAINPDDVESITVLKDAASAAIYGSRGGSGVVVVTTKKGTSGLAKFSYSSKYGWGEKTDDRYEMMNAVQKLEYERQLFELGGTAAPYRTGEEREFLATLGHDWQETLLKKSYNVSHNFSIRGGSETNKYFTSFGYDKNTGIVDGLDGFERLSGRLNFETEANDWFTYGINLSGAYYTSEEPRDRNNVQNPFRAMYQYNPYEPLYVVDDQGNVLLDAAGEPIWNTTSAGFSISEAIRNNPEEERNFRLYGTVFADLELVNNLVFTSRLSTKYRRYQSEYYMMPGSILDSYVGDPTAPGSKTDRSIDFFSSTWYNGIAYDKTFNDVHKFGALVFSEFTHENYLYTFFSSKGFGDPILTTQENATTPTAASSTRSKYKTFGYATALDYGYDERYLLSASVRRDASSRFGSQRRWGAFWSVSAAWNISNENFMEDVEFVDRLKLRASYGTRGNDQFNDLSYYNRNIVSITALPTGSYNGGIAYNVPVRVGNDELGWEKVETLDVGLEFQLFNRRITGGFDYFEDVRDDFLLNQFYSYAAGGDDNYVNGGELLNRGVEGELSVDVIQTKDFNWNVFGNITSVKPTVKDLNDQDEQVISGYTRHRTDQEPFTYFLVRYAGVDPATGDALYYKRDGSITNQYSSQDAVLLEGKSPNPDYYGGFGTRLTYKGIELSTSFNFQHGNYIYNIMAFNSLSDGANIGQNQRTDAFNYWRNPGDINVLPAPGRGTDQDSDRWLQDGSYLRWRNVSIGYNFNKDFISALPVESIKVYGSAQNLFTWTAYEGDPEVGYGSAESQATTFVSGEYSLYSYPAQRTFLLGIDVSF